MKLTPEIEAQGLKAYEQVCAFEALRQRKLPRIYAAFTLLLVVVGVAMERQNQPKLAVAFFTTTIVFAFASGLSWRRLKARYAANLIIVEEMEKTYGDQLQWVQVEKHFAALGRLKRELAAEQRAKERGASSG